MSPFEEKRQKTNRFINSLKDLNFKECSPEVVSAYLHDPKDESNPIAQFFTIPEMDMESATQFFERIKKDASYGKKDISILDLKDKVNSFVKTFKDYGMTHKSFVKGLTTTSRPSVLTKSFPKLRQNIDNIVEAFKGDGMTHNQMTSNATKSFALFYIDSADTINKVKGVCDKYANKGLTVEHYLNMANTTPGLFAARPETIVSHLEIIEDIYKQGLFELKDGETFWEAVGRKPRSLTESSETLKERVIYTRIKNAQTPKTETPSFVGFMKPKVEAVKKYNKENSPNFDLKKLLGGGLSV